MRFSALKPNCLPEDTTVTTLAGLGEFVAGETASLIQLRLEPVPAVNECIDWVVAARPFIVAPLAGISLMTHGAVQAIHRGHSPVKVVAPSDRVRLGAHHRMALIAVTVWKGTLFSPCHRLEHRACNRHELVAENALGVRGPSGFCMLEPERRSVVKGPFGQRVIARLTSGGDLCMANRAVAYAVIIACPPGLVAHGAVPHRGYVQLRNRGLLVDARVTGFAIDAHIAVVGQVFGVRELQVSPVHAVPRHRHRPADIAARYLSSIGVHNKAAKLMIVWILLLDGSMAAEAVLIF